MIPLQTVYSFSIMNEESPLSSNAKPSFFSRGMFWMLVGVTMACSGTLWLLADRAASGPLGRPKGFYVAIIGFLVYVAGRIMQVIQKSRKAKADKDTPPNG